MTPLHAHHRTEDTQAVPIASLKRMVIHDPEARAFVDLCADLDANGMMFPVFVHEVDWPNYLLWRRHHVCTEDLGDVTEWVRVLRMGNQRVQYAIARGYTHIDARIFRDKGRLNEAHQEMRAWWNTNRSK